MTQNTKGKSNQKTAIQPFDVTPEDITWRMRYSWLEDVDAGSTPVIDNVLPYLESEAISRLEKELDVLKHEPPKRRDGFDRWRLWWLNEALHNCDSHNPVGHAGDHLSKVGQSAVNILIVASELRDSIHYQKAEKSAALGMLLISEALTGGCSIQFESMERKAKKSYENGIGSQSKDFKLAKSAGIKLAASLWEKDQDLRIGEVAKKISDGLKKNAEKLPTLEAFPKIEAIKGWLKEAGKDGRLTIPPGAQRRGRPAKTAE